MFHPKLPPWDLHTVIYTLKWNDEYSQSFHVEASAPPPQYFSYNQ